MAAHQFVLVAQKDVPEMVDKMMLESKNSLSNIFYTIFFASNSLAQIGATAKDFRHAVVSQIGRMGSDFHHFVNEVTP